MLDKLECNTGMERMGNGSRLTWRTTATVSATIDSPVAQQSWSSSVSNGSHEYLKCNADASFYNAAGVMGGGWCLHDHRGRLILTGTNIIKWRLKTLEGEKMLLKEAICEVMQRSLSHVIF
jgi:hypothetical protein